MLSLLLKKQKKDLRREYLFRFLNTLFSFALISAVGWIVFLLPSYVSVDAELRELEVRVQNEAGAELSSQREILESQIAGLNETIKLFEAEPVIVPTDIVRAITNAQSGEISINTINMVGLNTDTRAISVQGISTDRDALRDFSRILGAEEIFEEVELPLSDFIKESEIPFSIDLKISAEYLEN